MSADFPETLFADTEETADTEERPSPWEYVKHAVIAVVAMAYLAMLGYGVYVVVSDLLGWGVDNAIMWPGMSPSLGRQRLRHDVLTVTRQLTCVAAIGVVLGLWWRRRLATVFFGVAAVAALIAGLTVHALAAEDQPDRPAWEDAPRYCQEHSGGDVTCPGD
jgi:uncharacterized ion transporter superfamily protein YfcC